MTNERFVKIDGACLTELASTYLPILDQIVLTLRVLDA